MCVNDAAAQRDIFAAHAKSDSRRPLPLALACWLYLFFLGTAFAGVVPIFVRLFDGLQVGMPWLTRLVLVSYWWALPLFSLVAIAVALVRQVVSLNQARATDAYLFFVAVVPSLVVLALHMPTLELLWKAYSLE